MTTSTYLSTPITIENLTDWRRDNRLEAISVTDGLPESVFETYSAFANTEGGIIVLGIADIGDGTLDVEGVEDGTALVKDFWSTVNRRQKVSSNILTTSTVSIESVEGVDVIVIRVPRAERTSRPVYIGPDAKTGTFRRNQSGNYRCNADEVSLMMRDASLVTDDQKLIVSKNFYAFDKETIRRYRRAFGIANPNHPWNSDDDEIFIRKIGAMRQNSETGKFHPTGAGLLLFGYEYDIRDEFPQYILDYKEQRVQTLYTRWTDRVTSQSGDWSGNLFDFLQKVIPKLQSGISEHADSGNGTSPTDAVSEAMVHTVTNADFYGRRGITVQKKNDGLTFGNPGTLRLGLAEALETNESDPRNPVILRILGLVGYSLPQGSPLKSIFKVWQKFYGSLPKIEIASDGIDRTTLYLPLEGAPTHSDNKLSLVEQVEYSTETDPKSKGENTQSKDESTVEIKISTVETPISKVEAELSKVEIQGLTSKFKEPEFIPHAETKSHPNERNEAAETTLRTTARYTKSKVKRKREKNKDKVLKLLGEEPRLTLPEVAEEIGLSLGGVEKIVRQLKTAGLLLRRGSTKAGEWVVTEVLK